MSKSKSIVLLLLVFTFICLGHVYAKKPSKSSKVPKLQEVLSNSHDCSATITIRFQDLSKDQLSEACQSLGQQELKFHRLFGTRNKPVKDDYNERIRVNVYDSRAQYHKNAPSHFNIPVDNGGMYLEGFPSKKGNEAEFVTFEVKGKIKNLEHEYIHYLSGRFNTYGDFCAFPHDSHSPPENCPEPHPPYPHFVWWEEGLASYASDGRVSEKTALAASKKTYKLSEIFNTSYNDNAGEERVYRWGFLAVKFMLEQHRDKVEEMLGFTRTGDWGAYRKLVQQWGTSLDDEFSAWLDELAEASSDN